MKKIVELCNDVGVMVEVRDIEACHRLFQRESNIQLPKRTTAGFVDRPFAEDFLGSSHLKGSVRKGVLRNFEKFTGKHQRKSLFFNKVAGQALGLQPS